jgi:hypothetical protein
MSYTGSTAEQAITRIFVGTLAQEAMFLETHIEGGMICPRRCF